uniref:Uncharacterized protein n=1 Tax=Vespula pensylvanica TaxID=30213 RepID=A0A834P2V8_VESPE|nr:hypothetical protein H0235_008130 [Vespula pensylvanica]
MKFRYQSSSHDPWTNPWTNSQAAFFGKERNDKVVGIILKSKMKNPFYWREKLSEPETGSQSEVRIIDLILEEAKPGVYVGRERILYFPPYVPPPTGLKASSSAALKGTP